ncbi:hypothetical protein MHIB_00460 [Mycolicibacter hiberniae]|uniref:Uncharacterized protein n=1 Tax=Mycolicibacter hiberniae TaxID=29314 RepID=A0A7I7X055_9MYCO|nr:hypothetical protein MHIB_00460 [Mycolicibacter hiberniae]
MISVRSAKPASYSETGRQMLSSKGLLLTPATVPVRWRQVARPCGRTRAVRPQWQQRPTRVSTVETMTRQVWTARTNRGLDGTARVHGPRGAAEPATSRRA